MESPEKHYCDGHVQMQNNTTTKRPSYSSSKRSGDLILAPWYFEMLCFRLANASRLASCMTIVFVMELSKHGRDWVLGADIWRAIDPDREFRLQCVLKFASILGCIEVQRQPCQNGNHLHYFRLADEVQFVDRHGINGKLVAWMLKALTCINREKPKQTPRTALLLFAIYARKLVKRTEIDEYLENQNANASVIFRQIDVLCDLKLVHQKKEFRGKLSHHFVYPITNNEIAR